MFVAFPLVISIVVGLATWILAVPTIGRELDPASPHPIGFAIGLLASVSVFVLSTLRSQRNTVPTAWVLTCSMLCILGSLALQAYGTSLASNQALEIIAALRERATPKTSDSNLNVSARMPQSIAAAAYLSEFFGIWLGAVGVCTAVTSTSMSQDGRQKVVVRADAQVIGV